MTSIGHWKSNAAPNAELFVPHSRPASFLINQPAKWAGRAFCAGWLLLPRLFGQGLPSRQTGVPVRYFYVTAQHHLKLVVLPRQIDAEVFNAEFLRKHANGKSHSGAQTNCPRVAESILHCVTLTLRPLKELEDRGIARSKWNGARELAARGKKGTSRTGRGRNGRIMPPRRPK